MPHLGQLPSDDDGGGSISGAGSSGVQGNVSSVTVAMLDVVDSNEYSLIAFLQSLLPVQAVFADTAIEGVHVTIGQLGTTTNAQGYFRIDGVPPGTHDINFSKNNQTARTTVSVAENEMVTMTNISMRGSHADVGHIEHHPIEQNHQ